MKKTPSQKQKNQAFSARGSDFEWFRMTFCDAFSIKFHDPAKPLKLQHLQYNATCLFLLLKAFHFGIKNLSQIHHFSRRLPGDPFSWFYVVFMRKWSFGGPLNIQWAPKWDPRRPSGSKNINCSTAWRCFFSVLIRWCILLTLWLSFDTRLFRMAPFSFILDIIFNVLHAFSTNL